jgi:hypothetical protein
MRSLGTLLAAICICMVSGCGSTPQDPASAPLARVNNPSPEFGRRLSRVCEAASGQIKHLSDPNPRPGVDLTSIIHYQHARLTKLVPPDGGRRAYDQFLGLLAHLEAQSVGAMTAPTLEALAESLRVMRKTRLAIARLALRMRAPGCVDQVMGRAWRRQR